MPVKPKFTIHASPITRSLLRDLGVHDDAFEEIWKAVVEDVYDHFKLEPRSNRRPSKKGKPQRPKPRHNSTLYHDDDEDYTDERGVHIKIGCSHGYLDRFNCPRCSGEFEGDEIYIDREDTEWWTGYRKTKPEKRQREKEKKDQIPTSTLIRDEVRDLRRSTNADRRRRILEEESNDRKESDPESKTSKKRKGTW